MPNTRRDEPAYSPADICQRFAIPRTTLFRWEDAAQIAKAERDSEGQRIYRQKHLKQIANIIRKKTRAKTALAAQPRVDGPCGSPEILELLHRAEFFSGDDPLHGLRQLEGLARAHGLSDDTIRSLIEYALSLPRRDAIRKEIWKRLPMLDAPRA